MVGTSPRIVPQTFSLDTETKPASPVCLPQDPMDQEGVELLLGIATIVSKEIASSGKELFGDKHDVPFSKHSVAPDQGLDTRPLTEFPSSPTKDDDFACSRVRTVSIDNGCRSPRRSPDVEESRNSTRRKSSLLPPVVSPVNTRLRTSRKPSLKLMGHKGKKRQIKVPKLSTTHQAQTNQSPPNIMDQHKRKAFEESSVTGKSITVIHRKKFSWKNYPG